MLAFPHDPAFECAINIAARQIAAAAAAAAKAVMSAAKSIAIRTTRASRAKSIRETDGHDNKVSNQEVCVQNGKQSFCDILTAAVVIIICLK